MLQTLLEGIKLNPWCSNSRGGLHTHTNNITEMIKACYADPQSDLSILYLFWRSSRTPTFESGSSSWTLGLGHDSAMNWTRILPLPTPLTQVNPWQALAKSPHLTKVGRVAQHVHVEQLGQVVRSPPIVRLSELCPDGCTLPLDDTPLLTLRPRWPDGPDHLLQGYWWRHGCVCVCVCVCVCIQGWVDVSISMCACYIMSKRCLKFNMNRKQTTSLCTLYSAYFHFLFLKSLQVCVSMTKALTTL